MELKYTTPVPNGLFERMGELNGTELKALLFIIRKTLGWKDASTGKRKERDWISHSQFVEHAGISDRSVTSAVQGLLEKNLINTTNREGQHLLYPKDRQKCPQVFYGLSVGITAKPAYTPAKNIQNSPQRLRATKETLQNSREQELPMFSLRENIEREEERMQYKRNRWGY
jgi:hypothetical protein